MAITITLPRLGWSMDEGTFVRWLKNAGEPVRIGEPLFELEGEKATQEIEAIDSGVLFFDPRSPAPGTMLPVGAVLGYLLADGEKAPAAEALAAEPKAESMGLNVISPPDTFEIGVAVQSDATEEASMSATSRLHTPSSPRARRAAAELDIDWKKLRGTGRGGRVRERDVRAEARLRIENAGGTISDSYSTSLRHVIARRLSASRQMTVPVTLTTRADATNLVSLREQFKSNNTAPVPTYTDISAKIVALALLDHPRLNARWENDQIVQPEGIHIGIAVDTEEGLVVPVLQHVLRLSLAELVTRSLELTERARSRRSLATDLQGGTFTITNLGHLGIDAFTPIINYPESAILGLGAIRFEPIVLKDGRVVARQQITLSLTFDHRLVDGAPAARFLKSIVRGIEAPAAWLIEH